MTIDTTVFAGQGSETGGGMRLYLDLDMEEAVALRERMKSQPFPAAIEDFANILDRAIYQHTERREDLQL